MSTAEKSGATVSIVVPVYFNEESLPKLFETLQAVADSDSLPYEFIFVDDGSKDGSYRLLTGFAAREPRARVLKLSRNFGSFTAIVAGLSYATGSCCAIISADLQDPPELIPRMARLWEDGNEVVLAVRGNREDSWLDKFFASIYWRLMRLLVLPDMPEGGFDFMLIDRKVVDIVVETREKNTSLPGLVLWMGFNRATLTYTRRAREAGQSRWTVAKKVKYFIDSFVAFSFLPVRVISAMGLAMAAAACAYSVFLIFAYFYWNIEIRGWPSLMLVTLALGALQLVMLGVLGEYLWRSLDETRRRPLFVVQDSRGFAAGGSGPSLTREVAAEVQAPVSGIR